MEKKEISLPDPDGVPSAMIPGVIGAMIPFIEDLDGEHYDIYNVIPKDDPAVIAFQELQKHAATCIGRLTVMLAQTMMPHTHDAETLLWEFLMHQIQVRMGVINSLIQTLKGKSRSDVNYALSSQAAQVARLTLVIDQFNDKGWDNGTSTSEQGAQTKSAQAAA